MINAYTGEKTPDDQVVFQDGILLIIQKDCFGVGVVERRYIHADFDEEVLTLKDITEQYPDVDWLIYEMGLSGEVYHLGNHKEGEWELVGETVGYA